MRFYSDILNKPFDTEEELRAAEAKENEKLELAKVAKEKRAAAAKEVEDAFKVANDAYKAANEKLKAFCNEYGSYHTSVTTTTGDAWDRLFNDFWFRFFN